MMLPSRPIPTYGNPRRPQKRLVLQKPVGFEEEMKNESDEVAWRYYLDLGGDWLVARWS
jgi:hypothetical protein